jgi:hypothetical protein
MYPGHFAAGLALKAYQPRASTLGLVVGVGWLDVVHAVFTGFHLEGGTVAHIDCTYSHSLATSLVWCALYAAFFYSAGARTAALMFVAAFSHWPLDVLSHNPDMDLWPHSRIELGFGPLFGGLGGWFEIAWTALGCALHLRSARRSVAHGRHYALAVGVVAVTLLLEILYVQKPSGLQ